MSVIELNEGSLVALVGCAGSGKTSFAHRHFAPYQVLSSDVCRGLVADDENDQNATPDAFEVLYFIAGKRLAKRRLTVIDATNVNAFAREQVVRCAQQHDAQCVAIVLDLPLNLCIERATSRVDRHVRADVVRSQHELLQSAISGLTNEGFSRVHLISSVDELDETAIAILSIQKDEAARAPGTSGRQ
jgi:protein phosphatase